MGEERPIPAVKAFIEKDGKILALETEPGDETYWVLPGGKVEYGETPHKALKRELMEELSCDAGIGEPVGMYHFFQGADDSGDQVVLTAFEASIDGEIDLENNPADENIKAFRWLSPEDFIERSSNDSLKSLLRNYL